MSSLLSSRFVLVVCAALAGAACAKDPAKIYTTFDARGITTVIVRADRVEQLLVHTDSRASNIRIWGTPVGGAGGYRPADSNWKETPPEEWGLEFVGKVYSDVLIIAVRNEISHLHHNYRLDALNIMLPPGIRVVPDRSVLDGDGAPDLSPPEQA